MLGTPWLVIKVMANNSKHPMLGAKASDEEGRKAILNGSTKPGPGQSEKYQMRQEQRVCTQRVLHSQAEGACHMPHEGHRGPPLRRGPQCEGVSSSALTHT
eukprot:1148597-Pelagomonas_calceolata.AAC.6